MIFSKKPQKAIREECQKCDLASRISFNANRASADNAIRSKALTLHIEEEWQKTINKSKKEIEQDKYTSGHNTWNFSLVGYENEFPNQRIKLPDTYGPAIEKQNQLILNYDAIILRSFHGGFDGSNHNPYYTTAPLSFGRMLGIEFTSPLERLLGTFFKDIIANPSEYIYSFQDYNREYVGGAMHPSQINRDYRVILLYSKDENLIDKVIRPSFIEQGYEKLSTK
jgi:hypothetical protein